MPRPDPLAYAPAALGVTAVVLSAIHSQSGDPGRSSTNAPMQVRITSDALIQMGTNRARADLYAAELSRTCNLFQINTRERIGHFLGQGFFESGGMSQMREGASIHASSHSTFSGRGFFQLTGDNEGRSAGNYESYRAFLSNQSDVPYMNVVSRPLSVETNPYACHSAGWYWSHNNLSQWADEGLTETASRHVSMAVACGPRSISRGYCTYVANVRRSDCTRRNVPGMGMRSVCTNPNGFTTTPSRPGRWEYTQRAFRAIEDGLVIFMPETESDVDKSVRRLKGAALGTVKHGATAKPSDTLALFKFNEAKGQEEINPAGVAALGALALLAFLS